MDITTWQHQVATPMLAHVLHRPHIAEVVPRNRIVRILSGDAEKRVPCSC